MARILAVAPDEARGPRRLAVRPARRRYGGDGAWRYVIALPLAGDRSEALAAKGGACDGRYG